MDKSRTSREIRAEFLKFFEEKGHEIVSSASLVPHGDPTLLFTNAGMNQFKDVFLGKGDRPYKRAADTQKCLRVSGKHNDLEEVGYDTYHHTFFEMLGNWSFGDYFKREAIGWAWQLLVERWGLDPNRLYATVHEGDSRLGLQPDTEAADLWKSETTIPPDHVLYFGSKDNFWMMGDTGPCGPCSEIHIDLRPEEERRAAPGSALVNANDPRVMEIWNLVFIQYNALQNGTLAPLDARHVDTGMGFERMAAVLQGKQSNYDTDLFAPLLQKIADLTSRPEIQGYDSIDAASEAERERIRVAMRVVADHLRTISFAVADGVTPGNAGRGYVIRRILRRAVRYGYQTLGFREPFLYRLFDTLRETMGDQFPELERNQAYIERAIRAEEESFLETLGTGISFFERIIPYLTSLAALEENSERGASLENTLAEMRQDRQTFDLLEKAYSGFTDEEILNQFSAAASRREIPGEIAFLLHDTYGFPVDLTQLMSREASMSVDMSRYDALMQEQKDRARAATTFKAAAGGSDEWQKITTGEDSFFVGYDKLEVEDAAIREVRQVQVDKKEEYQIILDQTPFYAESGGQTGDTGILKVGDDELQVLDTQKQGTRTVHYVDRLPAAMDAPVSARVDATRRQRIKKHHTATHLLHAVLREVLGAHIAQKGSLVAPDRLRFDFSHFERVTADELREIEHRVNEAIQRNIRKQEERHVPIEQALARGATALFGEKYGDHVRIITFDPGFSVELCGGTHVDATGEIGLFHFISEGSVAAGIRRVEAVTGSDALGRISREIDDLEKVRGQFRRAGRPAHEEVADLLSHIKSLEKELDQMRRLSQSAQLDALVKQAVPVGPASLVIGRVEPSDMETLRTLGQTLRERVGACSVGVLGAVDPAGDKVYIVASVSDDLIREKGLKAGEIVNALAKRVGGGGGGRPTLASAGGREPENLDKALALAPALIQEMF